MAITLILWLFSSIIFFFILHIVIQSAIDNSEMAQTLKAIERHLAANIVETPTETPIEEEEADKNVFDEECPACNHKIRSDTKECPSCGLTLIN